MLRPKKAARWGVLRGRPHSFGLMNECGRMRRWDDGKTGHDFRPLPAQHRRGWFHVTPAAASELCSNGSVNKFLWRTADQVEALWSTSTEAQLVDKALNFVTCGGSSSKLHLRLGDDTPASLAAGLLKPLLLFGNVESVGTAVNIINNTVKSIQTKLYEELTKLVHDGWSTDCCQLIFKREFARLRFSFPSYLTEHEWAQAVGGFDDSGQLLHGKNGYQIRPAIRPLAKPPRANLSLARIAEVLDEMVAMEEAKTDADPADFLHKGSASIIHSVDQTQGDKTLATRLSAREQLIYIAAMALPQLTGGHTPSRDAPCGTTANETVVMNCVRNPPVLQLPQGPQRFTPSGSTLE